MNLDSTSIVTILRINGLTPQSPVDQINALLSKAGYNPEEIQNALATLSGKAPAVSSIPAQPIAQYTAQPLPASELQGMPVPPSPQPSAPIASVSAEPSPVQQTSSVPQQPAKKSNAGMTALIVVVLVVLLGLGGAGYYFFMKANASPTTIPFPTSTGGRPTNTP